MAWKTQHRLVWRVWQRTEISLLWGGSWGNLQPIRSNDPPVASLWWQSRILMVLLGNKVYGQGQLGQESPSSCPQSAWYPCSGISKMLLLEKFLQVHENRDNICILGLLYFQIRRVSNMCRKSNHLSWFYLDIVSSPLSWILRSLLHTCDHSIQKAVYVNIWKGSYFNPNSLFCSWTIITKMIIV